MPPARAARSGSRSTIRPSADCTRLTATTSKPPASSGSRSRPVWVTDTPRPTWAANGKLTLVNSPSATSTRDPAGRLAATSPSNPETVLPMATRSAGNPTSSPNAARAAATGASKSGGWAAPVRQSCTADATASATVTEGTPMLAVFR